MRSPSSRAASSGAVLEAPAFVAGLDDVAVMGEAVEERCGHLGVAEDGGPFGEGEIGGDDDRGALVETADEVEEELAAGLREGQIAELVEDEEVEPDELVGDAALSLRAGLGLEPVDEVDGGVEAASGAAADTVAGDGYREMTLAGAGSADQHGVALLLEEGAGGKIAHQRLVDRRAGEVEVGELLGQRQPRDGDLVLDRARLLLGDLGLQQLADDLRHRMLPLQAVGDDLVEGGAHAGELQLAHHLEDLVSLHR